MLMSLSVFVSPVQASGGIQEFPEISLDEPLPDIFEDVYDFLLKTVTTGIQDQEEQESQAQSPLLKWALKSSQKLISLLIMSLLIAWLAPGILQKPVANMKEKTGRSLGIGAIILFLIPIAMAIFTVVIALLVYLCNLVKFNYLAGSTFLLGLGILLILIVGYVFLLSFLSKAIIGLWLGQELLSLIKKDLGEKTVLCMLAGGFLVAILVKLPWIGWAFSLIIDLFGIGAFWLNLKKKNKLVK